MEPIKIITDFLDNRFGDIRSLYQLNMFINECKLPPIVRDNNKFEHINVQILLYVLLVKFQNIKLKDQEIRNISTRIRKLFPEFTFADIYYIFSNTKKCNYGILYYTQVYDKIMHWFNKHQDEKIIYMHLVE